MRRERRGCSSARTPIALLFALLASPALHPLAPQRFMQLLGDDRAPPGRPHRHPRHRARQPGRVCGPLRAAAPRPRSRSLSRRCPRSRARAFMLALVIAFGLAFWLARRVRRAGDPPWLRRAAELAMLGLALALLAEIGGWTNLAALLGRGILASAIAALYVYAGASRSRRCSPTRSASPALHRSHLLDRNQAVLQRGVERGLRVARRGALALPRAEVARPAQLGGGSLRALLQAGVSVGALSLSIGWRARVRAHAAGRAAPGADRQRGARRGRLPAHQPAARHSRTRSPPWCATASTRSASCSPSPRRASSSASSRSCSAVSASASGSVCRTWSRTSPPV